jgi:hypothetical protein
MKDQATPASGAYEEGSALALCPGSYPLPDPAALADAMVAADEAWQSLHAAASKLGVENLNAKSRDDGACAAAADGIALELTADAFSSEVKKDADDFPKGKFLGDCGDFLCARLLEVLSLRSQPMGKGDKKAIFPLPTSRSELGKVFPTVCERDLSWLLCVVRSLNSMWGGCLESHQPVKDCQKECLKFIFDDVRRFCSLDAHLEILDWSEFFKVRSIDYKGDEVKVAQSFSWKNISPALPREIGRVPLSEVCTQGSRHYVTNFDLYLKPPSEWKLVKPPRVMVRDEHWAAVCRGLLDCGICTLLEESEVFDTGQGPLLNGLFGVSKEDWTSDGTEILRLIMNLIPLNSLCMPMAGDIDTLPSWSGMSPFFLRPSQQLLISSEDVKCFFYTLAVPRCWVKFLAFNKEVPESVLPADLKGRTVYLAAQVLPMGFLDSVSLAQHVHRNLVLNSGSEAESREVNPPEAEHRKDRSFTTSTNSWRVYLDNYDLLEKVEATQMVDATGSLAPGVLALRQEYEKWEVPRNEKKSVARSVKAEVQGATVDGIQGVAYPRESKLGKYFSLALSLCGQKFATQKQWQVVCGGLVYFSMFRRPLLGSLNSVWSHIESYNSGVHKWKPTPPECRLEVLRFLGLLPLARMDFRLGVNPYVTCSDASSTGGGLCVSRSLTPFGKVVSQGCLRGEIPENRVDAMVLTVGLFDGLGALRVAADVVGAQVIGHISVEKAPAARRVVEAHYPGTITVDMVEEVDETMVKGWSAKFSQCSLVLLGAGPPCQGVSGLNTDRLGALRDGRSCLFAHVPRIRDLLKKFFAWCPVYTLMESVASMDASDRDIISGAVGMNPLSCNAGTLTWCQRPRLYWVDWEIDAEFVQPSGDSSPDRVILQGQQAISQVTRAGWLKVEPRQPFPTFTTSRPQERPGRKPAGIKSCTAEEISRWQADLHRFPPYQYKVEHCLVNRANQLRVPDVSERELMMGFPLNYTAPCAPKGQRKGEAYNDLRLTLLGNSWSVPVVSWLLSQLFGRLGIIMPLSAQQILDFLTPGEHHLTQGRLVRLPLNPPRGEAGDHMEELAFKIANLVSIKGEDVALCTPSSQMARFHRLRASVPSGLWRWRIVAGWQWMDAREHINSLELRAILTSLRWRIEHHLHIKIRYIHLTDSLVCLHCLSRGRSSSRRLRRTMSKINALVLASSSQPVWGYVHTDQNPADKPSRWGRRVRTKFRNAK